MAKGLQSWSVKEQGAPITSAEIKTATSATAVSFSSTTRAMMGVVVPTNTEDLTLTLASGETIVIPGAAVAQIFAPGAIVPFACDSFVFGGTETGFKVIGLF
tara:strand:- start:310 stop:615 length:306 start_codon:yes stop_codon:yes gene_type:complete